MPGLHMSPLSIVQEGIEGLCTVRLPATMTKADLALALLAALNSSVLELGALWWTALLVGVVLLVAPSWTGHAAQPVAFLLVSITNE